MTSRRAAAWGPAVRKETRAIAPAFAVAALVLAVGPTIRTGVTGGPTVIDQLQAFRIEVAALLMGTAVVGALSFGHEFLYGTMGALLVQARPRRDLLLVKLAVLVPFELILAWLVVRKGGGVSRPAFLWFDSLPVVAGLSVAPWLAMAFRSGLAGAVFTVAIEGACFGVASAIGPRLGFVDPNEGVVDVTLGGLTLVCAIGAAMTWRTFVRLEVPGDSAGESTAMARQADGHLATARLGTPRSRVWLLLKKEAHLQMPSAAVAVLYALGSLLLALVEPRVDTVSRVLYGIAPFYMGVSALLVGAMSSAEERQIGTSEWHAILPMSRRVQWTIKVSVAIVAALLFTFAAPGVVLWLVPATRDLVTPDTMATAAMVFTPFVVIGIYVSSVCRSSLWAFLMSVPAVFVVWTLAAVIGIPPRAFGGGVLALEGWFWKALLVWLAPHGLPTVLVSPLVMLTRLSALAVVVLPLAAAVSFAMRNHFSAERGAARVIRQLAWAVALVATAGSAWVGANWCRAWSPTVARDYAFRSALERSFDRLAARVDGRVGICLEGISLSGSCLRPLESFPIGGLWKLPVALAALNAVDQGSLPFDDETKALLQRSIVEGDDAAAEVLVTRLGGLAAVDRTLRSAGRLGYLRADRDGTATPIQMAGVLRWLGYANSVSKPSDASWMSTRMMALLTAPKRAPAWLAGGLPTGWTAGDLSATTQDPEGATSTTNEVAVLRAPDGKLFGIAVFIANSHASEAAREALIQGVAGAVVDAY